MPEYIRSLVVVLLVAVPLSWSMQRTFQPLEPPGAFQRRRNAWLALTVCAFMAPGFWFYAIPASGIVLLASRREPNIPALFIALLFAVPPAAELVPGLGLMNFLLTLDHPRLLALLLLLPAALTLPRRQVRPAVRWPDRFFAAYVLLQVALTLARSKSLTSGLRVTSYLFIDVVLPYYVMSRAIARREQLNDLAAAFCFAGVLLAGVALLESARHWLLYRAIVEHWQAHFDMGNYLDRGGLLRALATTGQPIVLGFVLMVALACYLFLRPQMRPGLQRNAIPLLLLAGLMCTFSRGPWLGAMVMLFAFWATRNAARLRAGLVVTICVATGFAMGIDSALLSLVRNVDESTVAYRGELLSKSLQVVGEHLVLGSDQYYNRLAAAGLVQGGGIVDIVNTYVEIALSSGLAGLLLFLCLVTAVLHGAWKAHQKSGSEHNKEVHRQAVPASSYSEPFHSRAFPASPPSFARVLLASLAGILVTLGTTSSISVIPWVLWAWVGTAVAFLRLAADGMTVSVPTLITTKTAPTTT